MALDDWKKMRGLGSGGQGVTWLVNSLTDERSGVLKLLRKGDDSQARARMFREVSALKSLSAVKARVPAVLDDNTAEFEKREIELYFVMEQITGKTLREFVSDKTFLSLEESITTSLSLLETVSIGLNEEIIHRDIKPENIIVRNDELKDSVIVDYGLSFNNEDDEVTRVDERFDNRFLSLPERRAVGENKRDPRSDITGLAGIFYFCLTGHDPVDLVSVTGGPPHRRPGRGLRDRHTEARWVARADMLRPPCILFKV